MILGSTGRMKADGQETQPVTRGLDSPSHLQGKEKGRRLNQLSLGNDSINHGYGMQPP